LHNINKLITLHYLFLLDVGQREALDPMDPAAYSEVPRLVSLPDLSLIYSVKLCVHVYNVESNVPSNFLKSACA